MRFFGSACGDMGGSLTKANDLMCRGGRGLTLTRRTGIRSWRGAQGTAEILYVSRRAWFDFDGNGLLRTASLYFGSGAGIIAAGGVRHTC